jgi:glycosyltransferase involved in cell wall biosynthesis
MTLRQWIVWNSILCFENALARICDFILVVPSYENVLLKRFEKIGNHKTEVIWNLPSIAILDKTISNKQASESKTILYVGGISKNTGAIMILRAISKLAKDFPSIRVQMIGPSIIAEELANLAKSLGIEKRLTILKPVSFFEIWKTYINADISIVLYQPTFWNLRTMASEKLFESMLYSLPMIVSDFPGLRQIVKECKSGILVDPTNPEEVYKGLTSLLNDPSFSDYLGKNGRRCVLQKYNWETEEKKLIGIYSAIFNSTAG